MQDGGPGGLFCPACEYDDAVAAEYVPSDFSAFHARQPKVEKPLKYLIWVREE